MMPAAAPAYSRGTLKLTSEGLAWLGAAAVLGLLGWSKSLNLLLMLAYVMLALLALNGVLSRIHAGRVRVFRTMPHAVFAGEPTEIALHVQNARTRSATVQVSDRGRTWPVFDLPSGASVTIPRGDAFEPRGRLKLPPVSVVASHPFGFLSFEQFESAGDTIAVLPRLGEADADGLRMWLLRAAGGDGRSRKVLRRVTHDHADVRGIRPYRSGDSMRAVHWRSSARRRELMVREYDAAPSPELFIVVDPWLPAEATDAERERLEDTLSLAATIAATWVRAFGTRVTLAVSGEVAILSNEAMLRESLTLLADVSGSPSPVAPDFETIGRAAMRAARVVVSSRADSPLAASLAAELRRTFATLHPQLALPWYKPPQRGGVS
jgi:uncharacterized protein (DUF58 family)